MSIATQLAHDILDMQDKLDALQREITRLMKIEADYIKLVDETTQHNEKMMVGWIDLLMSDRIKIGPQSTGPIT